MDETATTRKLSLSWVLIEICFALSSFGTPKSEACLKPSIIIKNKKKRFFKLNSKFYNCTEKLAPQNLFSVLAQCAEIERE